MAEQKREIAEFTIGEGTLHLSTRQFGNGEKKIGITIGKDRVIRDSIKIRLSIAVISKKKGKGKFEVVLIKDGDELVLPSVWWDGQSSLKKSAFLALSNQVGLIDTMRSHYAYWCNEGIILNKSIDTIAQDMSLSPINVFFNIKNQSLKDLIEVYFDGVFQGYSYLAFDKNKNCMDLIFVFESELFVSKYFLVDLKDFSSNWKDRQISTFSYSDLTKETPLLASQLEFLF